MDGGRKWKIFCSWLLSQKDTIFLLDFKLRLKKWQFLQCLVTRFVKNPCGFSFYGFEILCESSGSISVGNPLTNITKSRWMMERNWKCFAVACYPTNIRFFSLISSSNWKSGIFAILSDTFCKKSLRIKFLWLWDSLWVVG